MPRHAVFFTISISCLLLKNKIMKWIFWSIWAILCIIGLLFTMCTFSIIFLISFLWQFKKKDLITWGYLHYEKDYNVDSEDPLCWTMINVPDKNPWATYKRWIFLDA